MHSFLKTIEEMYNVYYNLRINSKYKEYHYLDTIFRQEVLNTKISVIKKLQFYKYFIQYVIHNMESWKDY